MYTPLEITQKTEELGIKKGTNSFRRTFVLGILGGMFVAMGAAFSINTMTGMGGELPYGLMKLFGGFVFCLGLVLVILAGGELFTGNVLLIIAWLQKKIKTNQFLKNLFAVWIGNLVGSLIIVILLFLGGFHALSDNAVGNTLLKVASHKLALSFTQAVVMGILCNIFVCFAIWVGYSGKTATDKVMAIIFPITAFAAIGFEHIVANMFYLPYGYLIAHFTNISQNHNEVFTLTNILTKNAIPVTIGNFLGGTVFCGVFYRLLFLKYKKD